MPHAVSQPTPPRTTTDGRARIHQICVWQDNFSWILECTATGDCAVVDGPEAGPVLAYAAAQGLKLTTILTTHTHPDHIGLHRELAKRGELDGYRVVGNRELVAVIPGLAAGEQVGEGDTVRVGQLEGRVMLTEGHQNGHLSYLFGELLFCGDTLFAGGCGYLFDGPPAKMHASLERLAKLPGETLVCCAHEYTEDNLRFAVYVEPDNPALRERVREVEAIRARGESTVPSTIAVERATNPFLRTDSATIRATLGRELPDEPRTSAAEVFAGVRRLKDLKRYKR